MMRSASRSRVVLAAVSLLLTLGVVVATPAFAAAPTITSFTPTSGKLYDVVTITGTNFTAPATVRFNGALAPNPTVVSPTRITVKVPLTASTGPISVTTAGGTATSTAVFTVEPGLTTNRPTAPPGSSVTVYFSGFGPFEALDVYFDSADLALASAGRDGTGSVAITVPAAAAPGGHYLTAVGRHSGYSAQVGYTVRTDWTNFGYNAGNTGANPYEKTLGTGNVDALGEAWRTPGYIHGFGPNAPAIVGGIVYDSFADGNVRAYDETTGAVKWRRPLGDISESSPAVSGGVVYVGADDGRLYALNATTGAVLWQYVAAGDVKSPPVVVGGVVYFGSVNGFVYALNASTGSALWSFSSDDDVLGSPAVVGGVVYFGSSDSSVYALDAQTGDQKWRAATGGPVEASPVVANGRVYVGSLDSQMYALRASDGSVVWTNAAGDLIVATAALANGKLYYASADGTVTAVTAATGDPRWSASPGGSVYQAISVENGVVFAGDVSHTFALAAGYGGLLAVLDAGSTTGGPAVVDGTLTVGDESDGALVHYTLDADRTAATARPAVASLHPDLALRA